MTKAKLKHSGPEWDVDLDKDQPATVGEVRRLLAASARRRLPRVDPRVTNATARAVIGKAMLGRAARSPVSPFVADLARRLAGVS